MDTQSMKKKVKNSHKNCVLLITRKWISNKGTALRFSDTHPFQEGFGSGDGRERILQASEGFLLLAKVGPALPLRDPKRA